MISDRGAVATRYDERMLSHTKVSYLYAPGSVPVTFEADGVRFGCALGMEVHFPEIFGEYERLDVGRAQREPDGVLGPSADGPDLGGQAVVRAFGAGPGRLGGGLGEDGPDGRGDRLPGACSG